MADFRALCAELLDWAEVTAAHYIQLPAVILRARAALADEPAPEGKEPVSFTGQPSDQEIYDLWTGAEPASFARAVLARWGNCQGSLDNSATQPPADGEVAALVAWLRLTAGSDNSYSRVRLTRAAELLQRQYPQPVPVSERLPGPKDCDDQKRCWWLVHQSWPCLYLMKADSALAAAVATHWLPAHALPLPGQEAS